MASTLLVDLHVRYITALASHTDSLTYHLTTHLRLNALYWAVTALHLLRAAPTTTTPTTLLHRDKVVPYVLECFDERSGAFGAHPGHDGHVLATLSAVQILFLYDALEQLSSERRERVIEFLLSLQNPRTGQFAGDASKLEYDSRFLYCAVAALCLLSSSSNTGDDNASTPADDEGVRLYDPLTRLDRKRTTTAILACLNFDGGFGRSPGSESHASQSFVCLGALRIIGAFSHLTAQQRTRHAAWLSDRQLSTSGGLNGRPQKLEDVCYSWWVLSALAMLGTLHWINGAKLAAFILRAQDPDNGGIADRPDNVADVFHTLFGVAGLGMLGPPHSHNLDEVDPVYCLPVAAVQRVPHLRRDYQSLAQGTTVP